MPAKLHVTMQDMNPYYKQSLGTMINDLATMPLGSFKKYWPCMMSILDYIVDKTPEVVCCTVVRIGNWLTQLISAAC